MNQQYVKNLNNLSKEKSLIVCSYAKQYTKNASGNDLFICGASSYCKSKMSYGETLKVCTVPFQEKFIYEAAEARGRKALDDLLDDSPVPLM